MQNHIITIEYSTLLKAYIVTATSKDTITKKMVSVDADFNEAIAKALDRVQYITR